MSLESGSNGIKCYDGICSTCSISDNRRAVIVAAFEPFEGNLPASGQDQNENPKK